LLALEWLNLTPVSWLIKAKHLPCRPEKRKTKKAKREVAITALLVEVGGGGGWWSQLQQKYGLLIHRLGWFATVDATTLIEYTFCSALMLELTLYLSKLKCMHEENIRGGEKTVHVVFNYLEWGGCGVE
jgi:hypothetical protein